MHHSLPNEVNAGAAIVLGCLQTEVPLLALKIDDKMNLEPVAIFISNNSKQRAHVIQSGRDLLSRGVVLLNGARSRALQIFF